MADITDSFVKINADTKKEPVRKHADIYDELYEIQKRVSVALRESFQAHRSLLVRRYGQ
jgi:hypothetical protein